MADLKSFTSNAYESTLDGTLAAGATTINVKSTTGSPSIPFYLTLDPGSDGKREVVLVDGSKTSTSFALSSASSRGQDGTSDVEHESGAVAAVVPVAAHVNDLHDRVDNRYTKAETDTEIDNATSVVQTVTATSSVTDTTTATTHQNTSLAASITPEHPDSILIVRTSAYINALRVSGTIIARKANWQLFNETDGVSLDGAKDVPIGRDLDAASSNPATSHGVLALEGRYTVNSTATRTIRVRFKVDVTDIEARLRGADSTALITIMEVRP